MKHHDDSITRYVDRVSADPSVLGVVVTGSLARGTEKPTSDIDLYLVVTEDAWDTAYRDRRLMFVETDGIVYDKGYYDIKLATLSYLDDAAERGDDPVRDSFAHSRIAFSRVDDLESRLARAALVPDHAWEPRMASFLAQVRLHGGYFLGQGYANGDRMLLQHAALHLATSASRALFALNHTLYQGAKYLTRTVAGLERKPEGFDGMLADLLADPSPVTASTLMTALESYYDWPLPEDETLSTFILDNELAWRYRTAPPEYS